MKAIELAELIENLPADKKKVLEDLVSVLGADTNSINTQSIVKEKTRMKFGELKGFVTYIADDFDEPLEDFKDHL